MRVGAFIITDTYLRQSDFRTIYNQSGYSEKNPPVALVVKGTAAAVDLMITQLSEWVRQLTEIREHMAYPQNGDEPIIFSVGDLVKFEYISEIRTGTIKTIVGDWIAIVDNETGREHSRNPGLHRITKLYG